MNHESYKAERKKRGSQAKVAALLRVRVATISDRETGRTPISTEAWLALLSLPLDDAPAYTRWIAEQFRQHNSAS